jgi:hypothetical protein
LRFHPVPKPGSTALIIDHRSTNRFDDLNGQKFFLRPQDFESTIFDPVPASGFHQLRPNLSAAPDAAFSHLPELPRNNGQCRQDLAAVDKIQNHKDNTFP